MSFGKLRPAFLVSATFALVACRPTAQQVPAPPAAPSTPPPASVPQEHSSEISDFEHILRPTVVAKNYTGQTLASRMRAHHVPGVAIAIVQQGQLVFAQGYGVLQAGKPEKINEDTLFSAGSISKLLTAMLVLRMREQGRLALDQDVRPLFSEWVLPKKDQNPISWRMLLSHTAGLNIKGFEDLAPNEAVPTLRQSLEGQAPAKNPALKQLAPPGATYRYSGGGYLLLQLVLETLSEQGFAELAKQQLLHPMGLMRSTFENPLPASLANVAKAHDGEGAPTALPRGYETMPELAASGLWTSARELGQVLATLLQQYRGNGSLFSTASIMDMMTPVAPGRHGLGAKLEREGGVSFFYHAGANRSYKAWVEGVLDSGDGLVVLTNARHGDRLYVEIRNAVADAMNWGLHKPVQIQSSHAPATWSEPFSGTYELDKSLFNQKVQAEPVFPTPIAVEQRAQGLFIGSAMGGPKMRLVPLGPDLYVAPDWVLRTGSAQIRFHRNAHAQVIGATLTVENQSNYFLRTP